MKNTARKKPLEEVGPAAQLTLADVVRADLREFVIAAGTAALSAVLEHERTQLVGPATRTYGRAPRIVRVNEFETGFVKFSERRPPSVVG